MVFSFSRKILVCYFKENVSVRTEQFSVWCLVLL